MLAPHDQLIRWQHLLDRSAGAALPGRTVSDAGPQPFELDAMAEQIRSGRGRPLLTAILSTLPMASIEHLIATVSTWQQAVAAIPTRRPAAEGTSVADAVWRTYLSWRLGSPEAESALRHFVETLDPTALVFTANDNPEPWWQNEMVILHAVHSFALRTRDARLLDKTLACADFHLREIQPDHATNEPWSIHAYASHADGNVTAETLLHAGLIQHGGEVGPVPRLICRDAAAALAVYLKA